VSVRRLLAPSMAVAAVLIVLNSDWLYSSLYFYAHPAWTVYATALLPLLPVLLIAVVAERIAGLDLTVKALDSCSYVAVAFLSYDICKRNGVLHGSQPVYVKAVLVAVVLLAAFLISKYLSIHKRWRLRVAVVVGCMFFLFATEIASPFESNAYIRLAPLFDKPDAVATTNVVILVLDELSFLEAAPVETALRATGRMVYSKPVQSSGKRTDSAIPSLLTGMDMDGDRACSPTTLCSSVGLFDFADQTVQLQRFNVVGFYHPYCSMHGLAYCRQIAVFGPSSLLAGYGCSLIGKFAGDRRPELCEQLWLNSAKAQAARMAIRDAVSQAPFWKDGGMLYIHTLLPHPPAAATGGTLDQDYAANLRQASDFAVELSNRLVQRFGANYLFVITSDHPLRPDVWCSMYRYGRPGCLESRQFTSTHVPLIATGRSAESLMNVVNNLKLLESLPLN
jgi:hypothetical protein